MNSYYYVKEGRLCQEEAMLQELQQMGVSNVLNDEAVCADGCRCHGKRLDKPVDAAGVAGVYDDGQVRKAL